MPTGFKGVTPTIDRFEGRRWGGEDEWAGVRRGRGRVGGVGGVGGDRERGINKREVTELRGSGGQFSSTQREREQREQRAPPPPPSSHPPCTPLPPTQPPLFPPEVM